MISTNDIAESLPTQVPDSLTIAELRFTKEKLGVTWDELAAVVGFTPRCVYNWVDGTRPVPKAAAGLLWYACRV